MSIDIPTLARAYDLLHPGERWAHPPTSRSLRRISRTLSIELPESLIEFTRQSGACRDWLASLGEDFDSPRHILHVFARVRGIRRRAIGGAGRWEYVKPPGFVPINHGYDADFDCLDTSERNAETGEYPIQYWSPPRIFGTERNASFPEYMEQTIRSWVARARQPVRGRVLALLSNEAGT